MTRAAARQFYVDPVLKAQAESVFAALGLSASTAITMFYKQVVLHNGLPFSATLPPFPGKSMSEMTDFEIDAEMDVALRAYEEGRVHSQEEAEKLF